MSSSMGAMEEAPMSSSLGAMGPLLRKLDSLLSSERRLPKSLKYRIELLREDLEEISCALVEQSMVDSPNQKAKYWMDEARQLSFDIEDSMDNMMPTHTDADAKIRSVHSHRVGRIKVARLSKTLKPRTRMAKIVELRNMVWEAGERHEYYRLDDCITSSIRVFTGHGRVPALCGVAADRLVGTDDSKIKIIKMLIADAGQQLKVVPIVGSAGVGKTTLAKQVYREIGGQFECRAFVRASRKSNMTRLLGSILSQVQQRPRRTPNSCTVENLIDNLTEHLQNKRYFIVIDDLWETATWDIVNSAFPKDNNCSRIITTSEIECVPLECFGYESDDIFKVQLLGCEDSEKLFFDTVFGPECVCPDQLKEVSGRIIAKCAGLPLATTCVAGLLASQPGNSELWHHVQKCLCSNLSTNSTLEETLKEVLNLSYNSLPHYLKTCLLYLSMYPEGHIMWKVDLLKQWVSEGFITGIEEKDKEEFAENFFDELVNRGMIQPVQIDHNNEVLSCTMHHTILDLIISKSQEENFVTALDYSGTIPGYSTTVRRLSLHFSNAKSATKLEGVTLSQLRSFVFFGLLRCLPSVVEFKLLRVLILKFWGDQYGPTSLNLTSIYMLWQLRYLQISCDIIVELPARIGGLQYLETLKIDARMSAVPLDIVYLPGLLHLCLHDKTNLPDGIGRIRSLRTLQFFDLGNNSEDNVQSLGKLTNLQDLHLTCSSVKPINNLKRNLTALASSLQKLVNLKSITLSPGALRTPMYHDVSGSISSPHVFLQRLELLPPICIFSRLPELIGQLRKLCILKVVVRELLMKDIDILTGLPALTVLSLYVRQPTADSIIFGRGAFPVLKFMKYRCGVLWLTFKEGALPSLHTLKIGFNAHKGQQHDHLLTGIEHLLNLKEISGIIGAATGAEEADWSVAESALKDAIQKHPSFPSYDNVERVDWVDEEDTLSNQVKDSSNKQYESIQKQSGSKEIDSANEKPRILRDDAMEDTKQCTDRSMLHFPGSGSIILWNPRHSSCDDDADKLFSNDTTFCLPLDVTIEMTKMRSIDQHISPTLDEVKFFQLHATKLLDVLADSFEPKTSGLLSLSWMHSVLDSFIICLEEFSALLGCYHAALRRPKLDFYITNLLGSTVKMLDHCNDVQYGLAIVGQWNRSLTIFAAALASPDPQTPLSSIQICRARNALTRLTIGMLDHKDSRGVVSQSKSPRSSISSASSLYSFGSSVYSISPFSERSSCGSLRSSVGSAVYSMSQSWSMSHLPSVAAQRQGMIDPVASAKNSKFIKEKDIHIIEDHLVSAVNTMFAVVRGVAWALFVTVPCKNGSSGFQRENSLGLLKEIRQIQRSFRVFMEITDAAQFPLPKEKDAEAWEAAQQLIQVYVSLKSGLNPLARQVREVFDRIVRIHHKIISLRDELALSSSTPTSMSSSTPTSMKSSEQVQTAFFPKFADVDLG